MIEFPAALISKLLDWNKVPRNNDCYYDKRFTRSLLMALVDENRLRAGEISLDEKSFIRCKTLFDKKCCSFSYLFKTHIFSALFEIRCKGDENRMDKFEGYIDDLCREKN